MGGAKVPKVRPMPGGIKPTTLWLRVYAVRNTCDELTAKQNAGKPFKAQVKGRIHEGSLELLKLSRPTGPV